MVSIKSTNVGCSRKGWEAGGEAKDENKAWGFSRVSFYIDRLFLCLF